MTFDNGTPVEQLIAKQEIYECIMRYTRGVDRYDPDLMRTAFHTGATIERDIKRSAEEWIEMTEARDRSRDRLHHIGSVYIELFGDIALSETTWVAYQSWTTDDGGRLRSRGARYADQFERRNGVWGITRRLVIDDWSNVVAVDASISNEEKSLHLGQAGVHDPVYKLKREILSQYADQSTRA